MVTAQEFLALCVEGTKGAGKSTTIDKLAVDLTQSGFEVQICRPFTAANEFAEARGFKSAVHMIGASKTDNQAEVDFLLSTIAGARQQAMQKAEAGTQPVVLIYDRGWMTVYPHLFGGQWNAEDHGSDEIRHVWEQVLDAAPRTVFLHASFEITKQRRPNLDHASGLETDDKLREDVEGRVVFAAAHKNKISLAIDTGVTPQDDVVRRIADYVGFCMPQREARPS